jgi:PAS domain S-box-containing protein
MAISVRTKTVLVLVLTSVLVYLGLLNVSERMSWRTATDGIEFEQTDSGLVIAALDTSSFAGQLQAGDILISMDGLSVANLDEYTEVIEALTADGDTRATADYTFRKPGEEGEITLPVRIGTRAQLSNRDIPLILVAFCFLATGVVIFLRNWQARGGFHFFLICLTAFILLLFRYSGKADTFDLIAYWLPAAAFLLLPALFLHFALYFPRPQAWIRRNPKVAYLAYVPGFLLAAGHILWFSGLLRPFGLSRTPQGQYFLDRLELAHFLLLFGVSAAVFIGSSLNAESAVHRKQMKWISGGTILGLGPFFIFYGIPFLLNWPIRGWMEASLFSLAVIPLTFGYAITKYRLSDVDLIFKKGIAYVLASSTLLACYVGIAVLIGRAVQDLSPQSSFLLFSVSALIVAFVFAPLRDKIQEQLDRYFYKERYDYRRSLMDFGRTLASETDLSLLTEEISDRVQRTLDVSPVTIFLKDETEAGLFRLETGKGLSSLNLSSGIEISDRLLLTMGNRIRFPREDSLAEEAESLRRQLDRWALRYVEPLKVRGRVIGFLGLGRRTGGDLLTTDDLELLVTLSEYAAIAIDNALLYRSLEVKANEFSELKIYSDNVIESINLGVAVISPEGEVTVWNSAMASLIGVDRRTAVERKISELLPESFLEAVREIVDGPDWQVEYTRRLYKTHIQTESGDTKLVNVTLSPFISNQNLNVGTLIVFDDISEKVRLEEQLQQAEKLSSIGLFAAGLAHEVNTPLAGISSYSQMLLSETPSGDPHYDLLKRIETQSFRASEIINNLLNFARCSTSDFEEVNLNSLLIETLSLLEHQFKRKRIEIELDLEPSLPGTLGNGGKLQQVFMNLFLNAKDAMSEGGELKLRSFEYDSELVVEIQDSGVGISKEDIKRIYDPFFTTKSVGKGTGLGLSISYGIIQEHSGRIAVRSVPSKGTTFSLHLPIRRVN